jgi:hypothetical protein
VGKPEWKRPLGKPRRRRQDKIEVDVLERGWENADWIDKSLEIYKWQALVNTVMTFLVPYNTGNFFPNWWIFRFWRMTLLHVQFVNELVIKSFLHFMETLNDIRWQWYFMINKVHARYAIKLCPTNKVTFLCEWMKHQDPKRSV